jgi:hypothetical protein
MPEVVFGVPRGGAFVLLAWGLLSPVELSLEAV